MSTKTETRDVASDDTLLTPFMVSGYVASQGQVVRYYLAKDELTVTRCVKDVPLDAGGFASYSITPLTELPEEAHVVCPACSEKFHDKHRVTELS